MSNSLPVIRKTLTSNSMQSMIYQRIGEKVGTFTTSLLDLIGDNTALQKCDPNLVVKEAIKAPALDLPINNNLGFAYIIPYGNKPQFQMGYKGFIQLAIRTGQYKHLNADAVREGETIIVDKIRGTMEITGEPTSDNVLGYFAYMELVNGFEKAVFWTKEKVTEHGRKFSKAFNSGPWKSDFDAMAKKTVLKSLISKYGPLSIEMTTALSSDNSDFKGIDSHVDEEIQENANQETIDITPEPKQDPEPDPTPPSENNEMTDEEKAEIVEQEAAQAAQDGPGY